MADINRIHQNNFIIIGRAGMDIYPHPPGVKTEHAEQFQAALGGSSANIGVAINQQGGSCALVTCVSDDAIGRYALNQLTHYGIDTTHVRSVAGEFRNSLAVVESRVEDHQSVIYRNGAADFEMTIEDVNAVDYSAYAGLITTGTVFAAEPSRSAAFRALELAREAGLPCIFDVDYRPYSWPSVKVASEIYLKAASQFDIIIGNDDEFGFMHGDYHSGLDQARELAKNSASIVVYKMGEKGSITITSDTEFETGIFSVTPLKPTGAGDAFMGGFISAMANQRPLKECVLRGSASAAIVVSNFACAPAMPTKHELDSFIAKHPGISNS